MIARTVLVLLALAPSHATAHPKSTDTVTITLVGDIMLDGGPGHLVTNHGDPFADVAPILLGSDVTVGNLECAITRQGHALDKTYTFKGPIVALDLISKYFSAVSLANNHAGDWGPQGFADELTLLRDHRISAFGGGRNEREARQPLLVEVRGRKIALLGYNDFPPRSFAATAKRPGTAWLIEQHVLEDIAAARIRFKPDWLLLYLHWGVELAATPSPEQVALAHRFVDAGADAVIGSHPHVTQTIEWYRGRPIVYSLGNFVFDYFPGDPPVWTSYIVQLTYSSDLSPSLKTIPIELDAAGIPRRLH